MSETPNCESCEQVVADYHIEYTALPSKPEMYVCGNCISVSNLPDTVTVTKIKHRTQAEIDFENYELVLRIPKHLAEAMHKDLVLAVGDQVLGKIRDGYDDPEGMAILGYLRDWYRALREHEPF